jgi:hypothetical protein
LRRTQGRCCEQSTSTHLAFSPSFRWRWILALALGVVGVGGVVADPLLLAGRGP